MKYTTHKRTRSVDVTIDGVTHTVSQDYEEKVPVAPRDWDAISTRVAFGLVGILTTIAIVWSTVSIGALLGGGIGFLAAVLFDISWAVCLILEWKARFEPAKRRFPRNLGWLLLAVTMAFIGWHGMLLDNLALAVIGASVSLFAKVLWLGIMTYVDKDLSDAHRQWLQAAKSEAHARLAIAEVMRQVAHAEDEAVAHKLAIERSRDGFDGAQHVLRLDAELLSATAELLNSTRQVPSELSTAPQQELSTPPQTVLYSVATGDGIALSITEDQLSTIKAAAGPAALVKVLAELGFSTAEGMLNARAEHRPDINRNSFKIAIKRAMEGKTTS